MYNPSVRKLSNPPFPTLLRWAGLVLFLILVPFIYFSLSADPADLAAVTVMGLLLVLGAVMAFMRAGLIVDEIKGTLTKWWGLMIPFKHSVYPLAGISHVNLLRKIVQTSKGARITYPVTLIQQNAAELKLAEELDYTSGRRKAETFARFLHRDLHDETSGEVIVRESQYLDESIVQQHRRLGLRMPFRQPPPDATLRVRSSDTGTPLVIEIPPTGFRLGHLSLSLVLLAIPIVIILVITVIQLQNPVPDIGMIIMFVTLFSPWLLCVLLLIIHIATAREIISISPAGILTETRSWLRRLKIQVAADKIEEIVVAVSPSKNAGAQAVNMQRALNYSAGGRAILVRTDQGNTGIGRLLPEAEQVWLRDMLVHGLIDDRRAAVDTHAAYADSINPAKVRSQNNRLILLTATMAAGVLLFATLKSGILYKDTEQPRSDWDTYIVPPGPILAGYEMTPGPGSGYIQVYGRGVHAGTSGPDIRITIDEVRLVAAEKTTTAFRNLSLSLHRRDGDNWQLIGSAAGDDTQSILEDRGSYIYPSTQEFIIEAAVQSCEQNSCYFRLHILGQLGSGRPGWDVTEFLPMTRYDLPN